MIQNIMQKGKNIMDTTAVRIDLVSDSHFHEIHISEDGEVVLYSMNRSGTAKTSREVLGKLDGMELLMRGGEMALLGREIMKSEE